MDTLYLTGIQRSATQMGTRVDYQYDAPDRLKAYIKGDPLFVEFPCDMGSVPDEILAIPFVGIMATATMLLDVEIKVPSLEKNFLQSMDQVARVYENMYPQAGLNLAVCAEETKSVQMSAGGGHPCSLPAA